ncbi:hypothetical protein PGT21_001256 [Puccinia graminis f. sp. tritici]|uniref:Uncharacterized protein n=2 Tax=Puccinia graminis f. sp. tritici TaxID=56615 RepID=A0A5B0PMT7_PUCGR|nr:hypothetical protein PGT21_001256 [Puccinia graminis f. sp. tritici]
MLDGETQALNRVEIYGSCSWDHTIDFITRMIHQARIQHLNPTNSDPASQPGPIKLDPDQQWSAWKLITKYYEARLEVQYSPIETSRQSEAQAIVILWESQEKDRLEMVLKSFNSSELTAQSRIVIVDLDPQQLEKHQDWNEICFEHGFECHSSADLDEASMSWQCCPWPSIQRTPQSTSSPKLNPLLKPPPTQSPSPELHSSNPQPPNPNNLVQFPDDFHKAGSKASALSTSLSVGNLDQPPKLDSASCLNNSEDNRFEDDFSDFVCAGTSSTTWDDQNNNNNNNSDDDDDEQISSLEVEEMVHRLFGHNLPTSSSDGLGDLGSLVSQLDQLKLEAAGMDDRARKRLASRVAMAVESQLGSD